MKKLLIITLAFFALSAITSFSSAQEKKVGNQSKEKLIPGANNVKLRNSLSSKPGCTFIGWVGWNSYPLKNYTIELWTVDGTPKLLGSGLSNQKGEVKFYPSAASALDNSSHTYEAHVTLETPTGTKVLKSEQLECPMRINKGKGQ